MNVNASEATLHAITEALKLAALLDDRASRPDKARIAAWAEQVEPYRFTETDLLDGVRDFYNSPHDYPISVGDLIARARVIRQDRRMREPLPHIEARNDEMTAQTNAADHRSR